MSAFADADIIRLCQAEFVPVVGDDWYQRRRQDAEGAFFRRVSDQSSRKGTTATRQGIYAFTADGHLLGFKNAGNLADVMRTELKKWLAAWKALPADRTAPGAVHVPDRFDRDGKFHRELPPGGQAVRVFARILDAAGGKYAAGTCDTPGGDRAARDVMWLTAADLQALHPPRREVGATFPLPPAVVDRLVRFHLADNTRGEPPPWQPAEVRRADFRLTVTAAAADTVDLVLDGSALLTAADDGRGFDVRVRGRVRLAGGRLTRLEAAAVGDHWGEAGANGGSRPGRTPLGLAFELADGSRPLDGIPPQGVRDRHGYLGR